MGQAIEGGLSASTGIEIARSALREQLATIDRIMSADLNVMYRAVAADRALPAATRENLMRLYANVSEMKSYVDNPRGTYVSYRDKARDLQGEHKRLVGAIKLSLDISEGDD
jgi:HD superfamily phosphodiesterase